MVPIRRAEMAPSTREAGREEPGSQQIEQRQGVASVAAEAVLKKPWFARFFPLSSCVADPSLFIPDYRLVRPSYVPEI